MAYNKASRTRRSSFLLTTTAIVAAAMSSGLAMAQDVPAEMPTEETSGENGFGEIIVTATRQSESIQRVPISIQALESTTLKERQVKGLSDLATLLPSVSFAGLGPGRQTGLFPRHRPCRWCLCVRRLLS